nr:hypothetical protein [Tanacetum cinerariifolium]
MSFRLCLEAFLARPKIHITSDLLVLEGRYMEILLEPTSNKLLVEIFNTLAGNPVKEILLKLNLHDHMSILTDLKEYIKMDVEVPGSSRLTRFIATRSYSIDIYKDFMKAKEKYEHVGPKLRDYKMARLQDDVKRLCLVDDLKKFKITFISSQRYNSKPKVKDYYNISQVKDLS